MKRILLAVLAFVGACLACCLPLLLAPLAAGSLLAGAAQLDWACIASGAKVAATVSVLALAVTAFARMRRKGASCPAQGGCGCASGSACKA